MIESIYPMSEMMQPEKRRLRASYRLKPEGCHAAPPTS